jgi:hypothetical protein
MSLDDDITAYFTKKAIVHNSFGYVPDWVEIPLDDQRRMHWMLVGGEGVGGVCVWSPAPFTAKGIKAGDKIYSGPIYTQRFLKQWVWRTSGHVMVSVDTQTDGNKFLMIFDASKECTDDAVRSIWREHWQ